MKRNAPQGEPSRSRNGEKPDNYGERSLSRGVWHLTSQLVQLKLLDLFGFKVGVAKYWKKKVKDPSFHSGAWGGFRGLKFGAVIDFALQKLIWLHVQLYPKWSCVHHTQALIHLGFNVTKDWVERVFRSWGWTWKKPTHIQIQKYTAENMIYYGQWLKGIADKPWLHLKFADEAHFVSRDLYRNRVVGPRGDKVFVVQEAQLSLSFSLTLLFDLSRPHNPFHVNIRYQSNTEWDFLLFVVDAIRHRRLVAGDLFIVDNASIHWGGQTWELLHNLLTAFGVSLIFLPKYSPELNPCELVFGYLKKFIRNNRSSRTFLYQLILFALKRMPYIVLLRFFRRCTQMIHRVDNK